VRRSENPEPSAYLSFVKRRIDARTEQGCLDARRHAAMLYPSKHTGGQAGSEAATPQGQKDDGIQTCEVRHALHAYFETDAIFSEECNRCFLQKRLESSGVDSVGNRCAASFHTCSCRLLWILHARSTNRQRRHLHLAGYSASGGTRYWMS
jgi:hypothetical protein